MDIPDVPPLLLAALRQAAGEQRLALVGGAVRDLLLHRHHQDPWRGLPDLDLVVEGRAAELVARLPQVLAASLAAPVPLSVQEHGSYGTVELEVQLPPEHGGAWLLDVASARGERYPVPARNPEVSLGGLDDDLARRDFSVNAIALELRESSGDVVLLDPHGGQADLARRELRFLHPHSLRDDPTRLLRAARYGARLGFRLAPESLEQVQLTLACWPWAWRHGDDPGQAPPALGTRLRMELELLLEREPWPQALSLLQAWGGLVLLDPGLQADRSWRRRLHWARRFGLPLLPALVACASDPQALAGRLQLPHGQQRQVRQLQLLQERLLEPPATMRPSEWAELLEQPGLSAEAVALAIVSGQGPRRPLLRWWWQWRHLRADVSAQQLLEQGWAPGPALGEELRRRRRQRLDQLQRR